MWSYSQTSGAMSHRGEPLGTGYSGHLDGLNNPAMQAIHNVGPCPQGLYAIGKWHDDPHLGPCVALLTPIDHNALGRTGLYIHGNDKANDNLGSHGCIVLSYYIRNEMRESGDSSLTVGV